ncbi:hypothetical protein BKA62DRAFT_658903 [Auriculariales sp. MPI-PUGE-AT-0066]|nr:hypothetical protein BKA62DRAFT_658903 [Auriculariales sp. MPI-PUGE-AT-0066]
MPFGEIVVGSPGSGKSTYCHGKHQLFTALQRPISIVNLDPANDALPYPCAIDVSELVTLKDVMDAYNLGPNGAMLFCIEHLEANFDWLEQRLRDLGEDAYVVFDLPGQVELSTNHDSLRNIVRRLIKIGFRLCAVHLCDAHYVTNAANYVSVLFLSLRAMMQLELPHINVLSKVDLIARYGQLDFNLDFYTEVQDLSYLSDQLNKAAPRYAQLNEQICSLIEDYSLVGFETLAVEDRESMLHLTRVIDRASGYIFTPKGQEYGDAYAMFTTAAGPIQGAGADIRAVQERWVDHRSEYDAFENAEWRREAEAARQPEQTKTVASGIRIRDPQR